MVKASPVIIVSEDTAATGIISIFVMKMKFRGLNSAGRRRNIERSNGVGEGKWKCKIQYGYCRCNYCTPFNIMVFEERSRLDFILLKVSPAFDLL